MLSGPYYPRSFTILVIVAMGVLIVPLASGLINACLLYTSDAADE